MSYVETIVLVGVVALLAVAGYRLFGRSLVAKSTDFGDRVMALNATSGAGGSTCTSGLCTNGTSCFVAGTPVITPEGEQPIEQIVAGDQVLSADETTGEVVAKRVLGTFITKDRDVLAVYVRGESAPIRATPGHLFFTLDRGWLATEALRDEEPLIDTLGAVRIVDHVDPKAERATVYNFEVEDTHTYFVGHARVLVHNPKHPAPSPHGKLTPVPGQEPMDPETAAMLQEMGVQLPGTQYHVPQLPPNSAIIELSNDPSSLSDAKQYSAAHGVPVYFSYNLDPNTPAPPGAPLGGVIYQPTHNPSIVAPGPGGTTGYIPQALSGKGSLVLGSHGWPGEVQWGGPMKFDYWQSRIDGNQLVTNLQNAGYNPGAVDPGAHIYALPCNVCTNDSSGSNVGQTLADGFHVNTEGLEKTPGKSGLNAAGPVMHDDPPSMPNVPMVTNSGDGKYLVQTLGDDNGRYTTCTPN